MFNFMMQNFNQNFNSYKCTTESDNYHFKQARSNGTQNDIQECIIV